MSNKNKTVSPLQSNPMDGRAIYDYQIQSLEGKLLTFIESLGLKDSQEKSAKDIFRDIFYQVMYFETEYIGGEFLNIAIENWIKLNGGRGNRVGSSAH